MIRQKSGGESFAGERKETNGGNLEGEYREVEHDKGLLGKPMRRETLSFQIRGSSVIEPPSPDKVTYETKCDHILPREFWFQQNYFLAKKQPWLWSSLFARSCWGGQALSTEGHFSYGGNSGVELFYFLIVVILLYTFVRTHRTIYKKSEVY